MRTTAADEPVRLYHLDDAAGAVPETLRYGPLAELLALAAQQPEEVQAGLYVQTRDDVIAYLDMVGG